MIERVLIFLVCLAISNAGTIGTYFKPDDSSSIYSHINNAPNYKANAEPAPIYETDVSAQETNIDTLDKNRFSFDSMYQESASAPLAYNLAYGSSNSPSIKTVSGAVTYTTHTHSTPFELEERPYTASGVSKSHGLENNFYSRIQNEAIKTSLAYEEAPTVSHASFSGLGATYAW